MTAKRERGTHAGVGGLEGEMDGQIELHVPSILASHFEKCLRHLAE